MIQSTRGTDHAIFTVAGLAEMYDSLLSRVEPVPEFIERWTISPRKTNYITVELTHLLQQLTRDPNIDVIKAADCHDLTRFAACGIAIAATKYS